MKKNFINTVAFLLCGAMFFGSCEDMLEVESNRVEYEFGDWTFNDSVYSVLGILNAVQKVGDKQILLGELRGDLVNTNENTVDEIESISRFDFDAESNKYLDVKDYYAIINNCNLFLARVDTTLSYDNQRLMLREYVAVKSVRAWTYMQLMKNHGHIPFFTEPVLTNGKAEEIMSRTPSDQLTVIDYLIKDIAPYENPGVYPMPRWEVPSFATAGMTEKLFMPIRILLGDLYLWRASLRAETSTYPLPMGNPGSDYAMAAQCYYKYLTEDNKVRDNVDIATHTTDKPDDNQTYYPNTGFNGRFLRPSFENKKNNMIAGIRFAATEKTGVVSNLASFFAPVGEFGKRQIEASAAIRAISDRQTYIRRTESGNKEYFDVVSSRNFPGDLRIYSVVMSQRGTDLNKTLYDNTIIKFNYSDADNLRKEGSRMLFTSKENTRNIFLDRPENVYLRLAEALLGLEREGYTGAKELAMTILKSGIKGECTLYWKPDTIRSEKEDELGNIMTAPLLDDKGKQIVLKVTEEIPQVDEEGNPVVDEEGNPIVDIIEKEFPQTVPVIVDVMESEYGEILYDFSDNTFDSNIGIHSRGSGYVEGNSAYSLSDSCVAAYWGIPAKADSIIVTEYVYNEDGSYKQIPVYEVEINEDGDTVLDENGEPVYKLDEDENPIYKLTEDGNVAWDFETEEKKVAVYETEITDEHRLAYMYDKLIDEMALEMAFEGHRFGDLSRMATALGNPEFFARRVAARNVLKGDWRTAEQEEGWDAALYARLLDKNNWYLPLPGIIVLPITPVPPAEPVIPETDGDDQEGEPGEDIKPGDDTNTEGTEPGDDTNDDAGEEGETVNPEK